MLNNPARRHREVLTHKFIQVVDRYFLGILVSTSTETGSATPIA